MEESKGDGSPSWDEIWEIIGKKVGPGMEKIGEKMDAEDWKSWKKHCKPWPHHRPHKGGMVGRFIFMTALLYALHLKEMLAGTPLWLLALLVLGFTIMRL